MVEKKQPLLKETLFGQHKITSLASEIKSAYELFDADGFCDTIFETLPTLELKARINCIADALYIYLPRSYPNALEVILDALPPELDPTLSDDDFGEFIYAVYGEYISRHGCKEIHLERSLDALCEITKRFSMEYALREFLNQFPDQTLAKVNLLANSSNYHHRRLASEGLRPKLPWAKKLQLDHTLALPILETLHSDDRRFVTRSVANHLNDLSKIDPNLVIETLKSWQKQKKQNPKELDFITQHALRTLIKQGNTKALALLGFESDPSIVMQSFTIQHSSIAIGEKLCFAFSLKADKPTKLLIDYVLYYRTKNGSLQPKVHKIKKYKLKDHEILQDSKSHHFKANMTTRTLYPGKHRIALQINGKIYSSLDFFITE